MGSALSSGCKQIDKKMQPGGLEVRQGSRGFKNVAGTLIKFICASENNWCLVGSEGGMKRVAALGEQPGALSEDQEAGKSKMQLT